MQCEIYLPEGRKIIGNHHIQGPWSPCLVIGADGILLYFLFKSGSPKVCATRRSRNNSVVASSAIPIGRARSWKTAILLKFDIRCDYPICFNLSKSFKVNSSMPKHMARATKNLEPVFWDHRCVNILGIFQTLHFKKLPVSYSHTRFDLLTDQLPIIVTPPVAWCGGKVTT